MVRYGELRVKLYAFKVFGYDKTKKANTIKGATLKTFTFEDYKKCLFERQDLVKYQY